MGYVWIGCIIVFAVIEMATTQLVSVWFVLGSVAGLIANLAGADMIVQITAALVVSALSLVLLRRFVYRVLKPKDSKTNIDSLIGRELIVDEDVNNISDSGAGRLNGVTWKLKSADDDVTIPKGERVKVNEIKGVALIVSTVKDSKAVNV